MFVFSSERCVMLRTQLLRRVSAFALFLRDSAGTLRDVNGVQRAKALTLEFNALSSAKRTALEKRAKRVTFQVVAAPKPRGSKPRAPRLPTAYMKFVAAELPKIEAGTNQERMRKVAKMWAAMKKKQTAS